MVKNKTLIFLHIPKTAGISVSKMLLRQYPPCIARINAFFPKSTGSSPAAGSNSPPIQPHGRPLLPAEAGADIVFDDEGRSLLRVDEARHYAIVELPEWGEHDLKLSSNSDNFAIFAFTFGIYLEGA